MRVLVCGDRYWTDRAAIRRELTKLPPGSVIIEGGCPWHWNKHRKCQGSADAFAKVVAHELGFAVEEYPADWNKHGLSAGPIRNRQMLNEGKPDEVWAFHEDLAHSRGTADMVRAAKKANVAVKVFTC